MFVTTVATSNRIILNDKMNCKNKTAVKSANRVIPDKKIKKSCSRKTVKLLKRFILHEF